MERRQSHLWQTWLTGIFACAPCSPFTWRVPTVWLDSVWLGVSAQHGREFLSSWQQGCPFKGVPLTDDALCLCTVYYCTVQRLSVASNLSSWISRLLFAWSPQWIAWKTETERSSHFTTYFVRPRLLSPLSSVLLPVTQKSISAHHLEGCLNS